MNSKQKYFSITFSQLFVKNNDKMINNTRVGDRQCIIELTRD